MKKIIISIVAITLLGSSLFGADAYFAHINQSNGKLIEVNESSKRLSESDEVLKITADGIYLYSHLGSNTLERQTSLKSLEEVEGNIVCSSHADEETKQNQNILCQSMFATWNGSVGSTMINVIYSPLGNVVLHILTLGTGISQGFIYFAAVDFDKIDEFARENNLAEYQLKLLAK